MKLWLSKKKYTKIIKFDIHKGSLWANLSQELFVSLGYAWLAGTMSHFFLFKPCHSSCNHASFCTSTMPTSLCHTHFITIITPVYSPAGLSVISSTSSSSTLTTPSSRFSISANQRQQTQWMLKNSSECFFVNNLRKKNQLYIYVSLQMLESGNCEFLFFFFKFNRHNSVKNNWNRTKLKLSLYICISHPSYITFKLNVWNSCWDKDHKVNDDKMTGQNDGY